TARFEAKAQKQDAADDDGDKTNGYQMKYELDVELDSDPIPRLRHFVRPVWPFYVEGKVLSETGAEKELTFQPYQDSQTSLYYYKVKIPLWDDIKVIVPFEPLLQPAHYFFPMVKD